jgi:hypothetical protein
LVSNSGRKWKWIAVAALAAGGVGIAGIIVPRGAAQPQPTQPPPVVQPVQIGLPTISVVRP